MTIILIALFSLIGLSVGYALTHIVMGLVEQYHDNEYRRVWGIKPQKTKLWLKR